MTISVPPLDPEGAALWAALVRKIGPELARHRQPDLYYRHLAHRRRLSYDRYVLENGKEPPNRRTAAERANQPTVETAVTVSTPDGPATLTVTELPLSPSAAKTKLLEEEATYALPELIRVGSFVFRTQHWLDPRRHEPISVKRRKAKHK